MQVAILRFAMEVELMQLTGWDGCEEAIGGP